jgi:hypothetical protein
MAGSSEYGAHARRGDDEFGAPDATQGDSRADRIRRILFWAIGIGVVVAILGTMKWWGDQQQRATLHGRTWPPEPVKVFFGR